VGILYEPQKTAKPLKNTNFENWPEDSILDIQATLISLDTKEN
jgi:hypothetical protein